MKPSKELHHEVEILHRVSNFKRILFLGNVITLGIQQAAAWRAATDDHVYVSFTTYWASAVEPWQLNQRWYALNLSLNGVKRLLSCLFGDAVAVFWTALLK